MSIATRRAGAQRSEGTDVASPANREDGLLAMPEWVAPADGAACRAPRMWGCAYDTCRRERWEQVPVFVRTWCSAGVLAGTIALSACGGSTAASGSPSSVTGSTAVATVRPTATAARAAPATTAVVATDGTSAPNSLAAETERIGRLLSGSLCGHLDFAGCSVDYSVPGVVTVTTLATPTEADLTLAGRTSHAWAVEDVPGMLGARAGEPAHSTSDGRVTWTRQPDGALHLVVNVRQT